MREYVIMTDSCSDLTGEEVSMLGVTVLPMLFSIDGEELTDTPEHGAMAPEVFFERIAAGAECRTSAISVGAYSDVMRSALTAGKDVLCICLASALSTTYQSAVIAAEDLRGEFPEAKIHVIDSASASCGEGMIVYRVAKAAQEENLDIDALADFAKKAVAEQSTWFMVDDLNQLKRGGRVSALTALAGTALGIKPIIHCDATGALVPADKVRGAKSAIRTMVDKMEQLQSEAQKRLPVLMCHANCPEYVSYATELLRERFGDIEIRVRPVGPVIGSHTGCGTLGMVFVGEKE